MLRDFRGPNIRTVRIPLWVKKAVDAWTEAAQITEGPVSGAPLYPLSRWLLSIRTVISRTARTAAITICLRVMARLGGFGRPYCFGLAELHPH